MDGQKLIDAKLPCNPSDIKVDVVGRRKIHLLFLFLGIMKEQINFFVLFLNYTCTVGMLV
jgi:hypothetical protein